MLQIVRFFQKEYFVFIIFIGSIHSSSAMANHLQQLVAAGTTHRRSRNPNWTYHFPIYQQWLDLVLTLPYPIMLNEIVIKPHASSLACLFIFD